MDASDVGEFGILREVSSLRLFGALAGAVLLLPVTGCGVFDSGPEPGEVARSYARAFADGNHDAAARNTDAPENARAALRTARENLDPKKVTASVRDVTEGEGDAPTRANVDVSWRFGGGRVWKYRSTMDLVQADEGWKVRWEPSVIHPKLQAEQQLTRSDQPPSPAPVLSRDGEPLMVPEELVKVQLDTSGDVNAVVGPLADALREIDPEITRESILKGVRDTPRGQPYSVVTLRRDDYQRVKPRIYQLPGVRFPTEERLVAADRDYAARVLDGISEQLDERIAGKTGWKIASVNSRGDEVEVLHDVPPRPAEAVTATLSGDVQRAAEHAVDSEPKAAMLVAMQPSSGDVLAVAQNEPADAQGPIALTGQYPPGSTFKIATAAAALESGNVRIDTPVQCPATKRFDGRVVPNDHEFDLGTVPLRKAFAESCNTSFAQLAVDQPPRALTDAAKRLGVGVDFDMPGAITITGKVPPANSTVQRAENGFGQGTVLTSPFGMALASATVANGGMPVPKLVKGERTQANATPQPLSPSTLQQLRPMMRAVVIDGTAKAVAGSGEVYGKTGTAQFGDGTHAHGWFVGYRGDLAFAVLLTDAGSSGPAVEAAKRFLDQVP